MAKLSALALICSAFFLFLCGCSVYEDFEKPLIFAHSGEVVSLDPVFPYDAVSQGLMINVYETLIRFNGSSLTQFEPCIAEEVPTLENGLISDDGKTYTFKIRKGIRFHDGSEVTAEDVRYSLLRFILTDAAGGPSSLLLEPILGIASTRNRDGELIVTFEEAAKAVRAEGDNVVITLKNPFAPFLSIVARWSYVMSKNWAVSLGQWSGTEADWKEFNNYPSHKSLLADKMNGSGPYKLLKWDRRGKKVYFTANEDYWQTPAQIKAVVTATVPELGTRRLMLEAGDAQIIDVPRPFVAQMQGLKNITVSDDLPRIKCDPALFFTFHVNPRGNSDIGSGKLDGDGIPPDFFADPDVRKAFSYAFDYEAFLHEGLNSKAIMANGPVPYGLLGYSPDYKKYTYNLRKAQEHFEKAFDGKLWKTGFKFTVTHNTGSEERQLAGEILKKRIESLNPKFQITLRAIDWPSFLDRAEKQLMPLFIRGWIGDYPDPHNFVFPFYHSKGRYGAVQKYHNPKMDSLIEEAVTTVDNKKRAELYEKIHNLGQEEAVSIQTVYPYGIYVYSSNIENFVDNAVFMGVWFYPLRYKQNIR